MMIFRNQKTIRLFTFAQFLIVLMFTIVTVFAVLRLSAVGKVLTDLSNNSVPQIIQASALNNLIQSLGTSTTILSRAETNPARQLAMQKIEKSLDGINFSLLAREGNEAFLSKQLSTLNKEIDDLDSLVAQNIRQKMILTYTKSDLSNAIVNTFAKLDSNGASADTQEQLLEIVLLTSQVDQQGQLHKLRELETRLKFQLQGLITTLPSGNSELLEQARILQTLIISPVGIINQQVRLLQIKGRARGRGNFVRNLIADVASNLQYQSQLVNGATIQSATDTTMEAAVYTKAVFVLGIFSILMTLGIIYFLYKRIVSRLLSLSSQVEKAATGDDITIDIKGSDEIASLAKVFSNYLARLRSQESALLELTLTDPLTGIPNRRAFEKQLSECVLSSKRHAQAMTVMLVDVDYFKPFNDHYGHSSGDDCLRKIAEQLFETVSETGGFCARFGGEEFVCVYPGISSLEAFDLAEKLRLAVERLAIEHAHSDLAPVVTISVGCASAQGGTDSQWLLDSIVEKADIALYQAKKSGRNQSKMYSS